MTDPFKSFTVADLRSQLRERNLSTSGRKAELLNRLLQNVSSEIEKDDDASDDSLTAVSSVERSIVTEEEVSPDALAAKRQKLAKYRSEITLYRHPHIVLRHFIHYLAHEAKVISLYLVSHRFILPTAFSIALIMWLGYTLEGPHQATVQYVEGFLLWYGYWVILGIMSSVGLGTGLHTFVLFLGPHIAEATRAAYLCGNLNFDVRGDNAFVCMEDVAKPIAVTMLNIIRKVQWQSFFWGAGTAIGELPPYFVARAAALSGRENEELAALDALQDKEAGKMSLKEKLLVKVHYVMQNLGFFGIFLSASIPNPLFDLAGITCGHFLVPFATFFGATFLGKAIVKSGLQMVFVILMFSEESMAVLLSFLEKCLPRLKDVIEAALNEQAKTFGAQKEAMSSEVSGKTNYVSLAWNATITIMLSYFALSIVESLARQNLERVHARELKRLEKTLGNGTSREGRKSKVSGEVVFNVFTWRGFCLCYLGSLLIWFFCCTSVNDL